MAVGSCNRLMSDSSSRIECEFTTRGEGPLYNYLYRALLDFGRVALPPPTDGIWVVVSVMHNNYYVAGDRDRWECVFTLAEDMQI